MNRSNIARIVPDEVSGARPMPKASTARKARTAKSNVRNLLTEEIDPRTLTTMEQVSVSFSRQTRVGAIVGFLLGSWIPCAAFYASHALLPSEWYKHSESLSNPAVWVLSLALLFSIPKVYKWATAAFGSTMAGFAFSLLTEAVMVVFDLRIATFGFLILLGINGVSGAANIALQKRKSSL